MPGNGGSEQGLGVGGVMLGEQDVDQAGHGLGVSGALGQGQVAAEGLLGAGEVAGSFGDLGGEENVVGLLGRQLDGCEQLVGRGGEVCRRGLLGISIKVETGESAKGASLERWGSAGESGGERELGAGLGWPVGAGQQQAERDVRRGP